MKEKTGLIRISKKLKDRLKIKASRDNTFIKDYVESLIKKDLRRQV
jgi:hypothetical protein